MPTRPSSFAVLLGLAATLFVTEARATTAPSLPALRDDVWLSVGGSGDDGDSNRVMVQWLGTGAAALVAVPLSLAAASALGQLSNNLIVAAVPSLLTFLVLPSLATSLTASLLGATEGERTSFLAPFLGGLAVQLVMFGGAFLAGVTTTSILGSAIFAVIDAAALTAASVFLANTCISQYASASATPPPPATPPLTKPVEAPVAASPLSTAVSFVPVAFRF